MSFDAKRNHSIRICVIRKDVHCAVYCSFLDLLTILKLENK